MITTDMVKRLREETGAGVMDAKKTLEATNGDFDKAAEILREKGAARAAARAGRQAGEGVIEVYAHPGGRVGVLLEVNCESDFVARTEKFRALAHDLALQVAAAQPRYVRPEDVPQEEVERDARLWRRLAMDEGKSESEAEETASEKLQKLYEEVCLLEQPYVRDESVRVKDLVLDAIRQTGENIVVRRFARFELGQEL
jgi:elongation factor Ts